MEEACDPGRVNVSEDVHNLAKYEFEWQHRGKNRRQKQRLNGYVLCDGGETVLSDE